MGAREEHARPLGLLLHVEEERLQALADGVALAGNLLLKGEDAHAAAEVHEHVPALDALHDAGYDTALFVFEFGVGGLALGLADALDDDLFGGLGGDAAKLLPGLEGKLELLTR